MLLGPGNFIGMFCKDDKMANMTIGTKNQSTVISGPFI